MSIEDQPVATVRWLERDRLSANDWNPNHQAPVEHALLKTSILENGWTQPIVARAQDDDTLEIVDGFHRWLVSADTDIAALTDGLVPVVVLPVCPPDVARMSTVRHNRARGTHHVLGMADIVNDLLAMGINRAELCARLGMDAEEVDRLADRGSLRKRAAGAQMGTGWTV